MLNPYVSDIHKAQGLRIEKVEHPSNTTYQVVSICQQCVKEIRRNIDLDDWRSWEAGNYVQDVWPDLTPEEREELILCIHAGCSDEFYGVEE